MRVLALCRCYIIPINGGKSVLLKKRGANGGTWAHWQLALSYAQYLSPELHQVVNQVFRERLEETIDPELGINRGRERARKTWSRQGLDSKTIVERERGIDTHKIYINVLIDHDVKPNYELGICTNKIYKGIFNKDAAEIKEDLRKNNPGLPKNINIRDHALRSSLAGINLAEALASEEIEDSDVRGVSNCSQVSFEKGLSVRLAINDSRSKSSKKQKPIVISEEKKESHKQNIKELRRIVGKSK
jgi:hypothetical protein